MRIKAACLVVASLIVLVDRLGTTATLREELSVDVGGAVLTAVAWGQGEPILLLPGRGLSASVFEIFGPELASRGFRAIAVNPRGIHGSTGTLQSLTYHDYAKDIATFVNRVAGGRAHLLGWAYGNRIARCTAADYPNLVATVTLLAAGGKVPPESAATAMLDRLDEPSASAEERKQTLIALFAPGSDPSPLLANRESWPEASAAEAAASRLTPLEDWWSGGRAPMLVIQGKEDKFAPVGNGRALKEAYGNRVELVELAKAGHALLFERPIEIRDLVSDFLRRHQVSRRP